ncbi:MAG TPA: hypothetical protein VHP83_22860 [Aggregatilineaceae bacterium]|nr:hypothetical protein [Aggregatilineaceae bacterium]
MKRTGIALWVAAGLAVALFIEQTVLADSDLLTLRYVANFVQIAAVSIGVMYLKRLAVHDINGPLPDPIMLVISGLAALCLWAFGLWLMDGFNHVLEESAGLLSMPESMLALSDSILGLDTQSAVYELHILFAVVLIPLVQSWLLFGLVQPDLAASVGRRRAMWITGLVAGLFLTLTAIQNVRPALQSGLGSFGGYLLIAYAAALTVYLSGSPWTGFAVLTTFNYATLRWSDDLFHEFLGKGYLDVSWLTVIVFGSLGAVIMLQVLRFQIVRPSEPAQSRGGLLVRVGLPLLILAAALLILILVDLQARG